MKNLNLNRFMAAACLLAGTGTVNAQNGTWTNLAGGSWATTANWSGATIATGSGSTANFSTLTLTAAPTVTLDGARTIGNLTFGDVGNLYGWTLNTGSAGPLTLAVSSGSPTITVNGQTNTIGLVLAGTAGLTTAGAGTLSLTGVNTYTGPTTISAGTLSLGGAGSLGSGTYAGLITNNGVLIHNSSAGETFTGVISGTGSLIQQSGGDLTLNAANTYSGGTTLAGAATRLKSSNTALGSGLVTVTANATLATQNGSSAVTVTNPISIKSGVTLSIDSGYASLTLAGPITNAGNFTVTSSGTTTLLATNTYTGNTTDGSSAILTIGGAGLLGGGSYNGTLAIGNTFNYSSTAAQTLGGVISGSGSGGLNVTAGTLTLSAANTYTAPTKVTGSTLILTGAGTLGSSSSITVAATGFLNVSGVTGTVSLGSAQTLTAGSPVAQTAVTNITGSINSTGTNNIAGTGTVGTLTVNGNLALTNATLVYDLPSPTVADLLVPKGSLTLSGTVTVQPYELGNGTFTIVNGAGSITGTAANLALGSVSNERGTPSGSFTVGTTNITLTVSGLTPATLAWQGSVNGIWDVNTTANWLNGGSGSTFYNLDTVTFSDSPTTALLTNTGNVFPGAVIFSNSATAYTFTNTGNGGIAGGATIIKTNGSGTVYFVSATPAVANSFGGGTIIGSGTISLGNGNANTEDDAALGSGTITVNSGGTLLMQPGGSTATWTVANPITLNGGTIRGQDGYHHLSGAVNVASGGGTLNQYWDSKSVWVDGVVSGSGPLTINSGSGGAYSGIHFSNPLNTYSGTVTVSGNCLMLDNSNALTNATVNLTVNNGLQFNAAVTAPLIGTLTGTATENLPATVTLAVGGNNVSGTFAGALTNSGALTKVGTGTFTLTGIANTYTGPTTVSGGTLAGNGTINSAVTVQSGGTLAPGTASLGTFTIKSNLTLHGNAQFRISKTGGVIANDLVTGLTGLSCGGTLVVTNVTADTNALAAGDTFTLFNLASGSYSGSFISFVLPPLSSTNLAWNTNLVASSGIISVVGVGAAQAPIFSPVAGGYLGAVALTISDTNTTIYYTTDGSNPTNSLTVQTATNLVMLAIPVNTVETVLAYATATGYANSPVVGGTYATATEGVWTNLAGGAWGASGNWTNGIIGSGANITADFSQLTLTANTTIALNGQQTVGNLVFGDQGNAHQETLTNGTGGPLILAGSNTPSITVNNQNLNLGATLSGTNGAVVNGSGSVTWTVNPAITAGGITFNNAATNVILTGNFDAAFTPLVTINTNATLLGNNYHALGGGTAVVINRGTYLMNYEDYKQSITMMDGLIATGGGGNGGQLRVGFAGGTGTYTWRITNSVAGSVINEAINTIASGVYLVFNVARGSAPYDLTLGGIISNAGALVFSGNGLTTMTAANTYTGTTVVTNGTLEVDGSIASTAAVTVYTNATLSGSGSISGPVTVMAGGKIAPGISTNLGTLYLDNTVSLSGTGYFRISKTGGTVAFDQLAGYSSLTAGGPLIITNVTGDATPLAAGDTFNLFSSSVSGGFTSITLPPLPGGLSWDTTALLASGYITVAANAGPPTFSPPAGAYVGATVVTISSTTPGATIYYTLDGTTPTTGSPSGINPVTVTVPVNTNLTIQAYAHATGESDSSVQSAAYATIATPVWNVPYGGSWPVAGNWLDGIVANGAGATADFSQQTLGGASTVTLDSAVTVGKLIMADQGNANTWELDPGTGGSLTLNNGTNTPVITVSNQTTTITVPLTGTNGLVVNGAGTLTLTTNETYTGNTTINGGTLNLSYNTGAGNGIGGTLQGALTVNSNATVITTIGNALGYSGSQWVRTITLNYGTLETSVAGADNGWGTTINMTGGTLGSTVSGGRFAMGDGPVFNVTGTNTPSVISANLTVRDASPGGIVFNVTRGTNTSDLDISGNLLVSGNGGITLNGNGVTLLTGANTYTGATTVSNGTLVVDGSLAAGSAVTVVSGATLAGNGTIGGPVTVNAGGTLRTDPAGINTLTVNNTLSLAGTVNLRINSGLPASDLLTGLTGVTYGGTLTVTDLGSSLTQGQVFTLFSTAGASGSFTATNLPALGTGLKWDWNPSAGTLAVVAAVNTTPTNMVSSLSPDGTTLTLSWPADHLGWRLLVQTNNLAAGISGNPADWGTVTGSSTTNLENITINPALPSEFYQMVYP